MKTLQKEIITFFLIILLSTLCVNAQTTDPFYQQSYQYLSLMLDDKEEIDFKRAVFSVENAYYQNQLDYSTFVQNLTIYANICRSIAYANPIDYPYPDFNSVCAHAAIFQFMTTPIPLQLNDTTTVYHSPFEYNFEDYNGEKEWSSMFVSKLMDTHKGNCHSLPILYKLIAEEMGEKAWLALAPNHLYIKLHNQQNGWYNTELTSGNFPTDTYLKSSGYIHLDAIQNGIYMDTLSIKESIAFCLLDLALGYKHKYPDNYNPYFVLRCCEKALVYFPDFINALLLQASTRFQLYEEKKNEDAKELQEIEQLFTHIHQLGYRKMPEHMYLKWLETMNTHE